MSTKGEKLNFIQHWRKRPDTFIGSIVTTKQDLWVGRLHEGKPQLYEAGVLYNPGLVQICYEIISNAVDNKWRSDVAVSSGLPGASHMTSIEVSISDSTEEEPNRISVKNDGMFISAKQEEYKFTDPVTQRVELKKLYPAELYFGYDLSGTNYHDDEERKTSGRNGIGAKATNVFSSFFSVQHADPIHHRMFKQEFSDGMTRRTEPELSAYRGSKGWTQITFVPDFKYFSYKGVDDNLVAILTKMCIDAAMITGLKIKLCINGVSADVKIPSLNKYAELFFDTKPTMMQFSSDDGECVLVDVSSKEIDSDTLENIQHVSFVNGISTVKGGVHVDKWRNAIVNPFVSEFNSRKPKKGVDPVKTTAKDIFPYIMMFVRVELDKPAFAQQTKEQLTSPAPSVAKITEDQLKKLMKWPFVERLDDKLHSKVERALAKKEGTKKRVSMGDKLKDANWAGGSKSTECVLFITEGLSAKTFANAGIAVMEQGHDRYGAFAIRGKFMNIRKQTPAKIVANEEVQALQATIGLVPDTDYSRDSEYKKLRYGKVCLLTDADDDGIHIRGLLASFFYTRYPTLFARDGFLQSMSTPVVRIFPSLRAATPAQQFFSNAEYQEWISKSTDIVSKKGRVDYTKGLGGFAPQDAPLIFQDRKTISFTLEGDEEQYVPLGFDESESDARKAWITRDMNADGDLETIDEVVVDEIDENSFKCEGSMGFSTFIDSQLRLFDQMTLRRALPSLVDGLKVAQRKALYGVMTRKLKEPRTVSELQGAVKESAGYHHGENSLYDTIIGMAQGFVGANNIPLFTNSGMVGSRCGANTRGSTYSIGADSAAPRYVKTMLEDIVGSIYCSNDEPILHFMKEEGKTVEPRFYLPVLPMALVNGATGIATGYSTDVPSYNPETLVKWLRCKLNGDTKYPELVPWYRGFVGEIELTEENVDGIPTTWVSRGILEQDKEDETWWHVKELPIGLATSAFEAYVDERLMNFKDKDGKVRKFIVDKKTYGTINTIHIMLKSAKDFTPDIEAPGNLKILQSRGSLRNMVLLDAFGFPRRFSTPEEILEEFVKVRLFYYEKRRLYLIEELARQARVAESKARFIRLVNEGKVDLRKEIVAVEADLVARKFAKEEDTFEYLLGMPLRSQTKERAEKLQEEAVAAKAAVEKLKKTEAKEMWLEELDAFDNAYAKFLKERTDDVKVEKKKKTKAIKP